MVMKLIFIQQVEIHRTTSVITLFLQHFDNEMPIKCRISFNSYIVIKLTFLYK